MKRDVSTRIDRVCHGAGEPGLRDRGRRYLPAGSAELVDMEVMAIVDTLPADDVTELASIG